MCGLIGYSGKTKCSLPIIELIIAWNSLERGTDATGLYSPNNGLKKTLEKGSHYVIYGNKDYFEPDDLFIGHVRHATVGDKTKLENAHPFHRGNYVLAHNGTLKNYKDLLHKYEVNELGYNVDSDCIAGCISKSGNIAQVLSEIDGAGAFLIHDTENPKKLYVFRNSERPLYRGYDEDNNMYISSIPEPLYFFQLKNIKEFKEDILYTIMDGAIVANRCQKIKNVPYTKPAVVVKPVSQAINHIEWDKANQSVDNFLAQRKVVTHDNTKHSATNFYNNKSSNTELKEVDLFNNLWLRSRMDVSYYCSAQDQRVDLERNKYYLTSCTSNDPNKAWVQLDEAFVEIHKSYFVEADIIRNYDVVMVMENATFNKSGKLVGNKGDILQVNYMFPDGDISLRPYNHLTASTTNYLVKDAVRKLTAGELVEFLATTSETMGAEITKNTDTVLARGNEIMINEEKLKNFIESMDAKLDTLAGLSVNSYLNFKQHEELKQMIEQTTQYLLYKKKDLLSTNTIKV